MDDLKNGWLTENENRAVQADFHASRDANVGAVDELVNGTGLKKVPLEL